MSLELYYHPLSSFSQKVVIALYEKDIAFEPRIVDFSDGASTAALKALWPLGKIPVLKDGAQTIPETSIIIEYLEQNYPGTTQLLPRDPQLAREVRLRDRFYDLYVDTTMGKIVTDRLRPPGMNDAHGVAEARTLLGTALGMIDREMAARSWAAGDTFSMADCAAAPALFYADIVMPFGETNPAAAAYLRRLMKRPSVERAIDEARPYLHLMPK